MLRETMITALQRRVMYVTFTKVDGSTRVMKCSLQEGVIPADIKGSDKKANDEVLAVWDLEKAAWRSFRLDSVTEVDLVSAK